MIKLQNSPSSSVPVPISLKQSLSFAYPYLKTVVLLPLCLNLLLIFSNSPLFILNENKTENINRLQLNDFDVLVNISDLGVVRGSLQNTAYTKRQFLSFTGIPYGTITLRFAPAVLKESLTSDQDGNKVFDATLPQKACIQPPLLPFLPGDFTEDCLTLNIYTPLKDVWKNNQTLPVIVFIHGGSFFRWSGNMFNGRRFLERDVVLVTINYRLNIFALKFLLGEGFLCLENDEAPGNIGLYDITLALKWVKEYIHNFGGDSSRVTLAGQSAGGAAVTTLLDSPLTRDLFHGVIAASGDSFAGWAVDHSPLKNSLSAATGLGCANGTDPNQNLQIVLKCMRSLPPSQILNGLPMFFSAPAEQKFQLSKIPKIAPRRKTSGPRFNAHVPLMIGINRHDGSFLLSRIYTNFLKARNLHEDAYYLRNHFVRDLLTSPHFGLVDSPNGTIAALAKSFLGDALHSGNFQLLAAGLREMFSQFYFTHPAHQTAISHVEGHDVYFYSFDYEGSRSLYPYTGGVPEVPKGVAHGDDLMYLFDFGDFASSDEQEVSSIIVNGWVNFASTGNPNKRTLQEPSELEVWPKFSLARQTILSITPTPVTNTITTRLLRK